ncbi:hypothetical protein KKC91_11965 [bacterium]|nr:hypothetical protein [bacterium]MBU1852678.1 hypothetical protein [Candidatus Omnitrophota bacterium]
MGINIRKGLLEAILPLVTVLIISCGNSATAEEKLEYIDIFSSQNTDVTSWHDNWNGVSTGAIITKEGAKAIIIGTNANKSYGPVYINVDMDLDKFPILEINVDSVTHHWYLIINHPSLNRGYTKIQPDTDYQGEKKYDLRLLTGLSGKQSFQLQLGVSTAEMKNNNLAEKLVFTKLRFSQKHEEQNGTIILCDNTHPDINGWVKEWPDGRSTGATICSTGEIITIQGILDSQSYGCVYKDITLDLDRFPYLEIDVISASHHWYLILISPNVEGGFVKIQPDTKITGKSIYDLRDISGLSGLQAFQLQVGVGTSEQKPNINGETMSFHSLVFLPQDKKTDKIALKKEDVVFTKQIAPPIEREIRKLTPPEVIPLSLDAAKSLRRVIREITDKAFGIDPKVKGNMFGPAIIPQGMDKQHLISKLSFFDKGEDLIISNAYYILGISKTNGAIVYIKDTKTGYNISLGSSGKCLWSLALFKAGEYLDIKGNEFSPTSSFMNFDYTWLKREKTLQMRYNMDGERSLEVIIEVIGSEGDFFDLQAKVLNKSEDIVVSFTLPWDLTFDYNNIARFIFPNRMGVAFNKNFFSSNKRWLDHYPPAFCDFVALESRTGNLAIYMVETNDIFQPTTLEVGYSKSEEDIGEYRHKFATYIQSNKNWKSPFLRFRIFSSLESAISQYQSDNKLDESPTLKDKLGPQLFEKLSKSILLKVGLWENKDFQYVTDFLTELPKPTLVHLTSFWPEGFDKYYPDYLPPSPKFGSPEDFKHLIDTIHKRGLLAMPYTNPTWWNVGPTLNRLSKDEIVAKNLDGSIAYEKYNLNGGYIISPYNPKVLERLAQTLQEFSSDYPMDLLFQDQIGARRWRYDLNPSEKTPISYTQGLIDIAARDSKTIPVMIEGGFDKLIPDVAGFCGLTSLTMPHFGEFDRSWGKGNWELYPLAIYLAHPYVALYQHNLANEVFTDSKAKLTWNLTYGHNLSQGRWIVQWERQKPWMWIADAFQKAVASRCFGKRLTKFMKVNKDVILSQFEDISILSNHSKVNTFPFDNYTIAEEGFLATDNDRSLIAGIFTVFNGSPLWDELFLIVEKDIDNITVHQPFSRASLVTILRPNNWINDDWIHVYHQLPNDQEEVISAISPKDITFLYEASQENSKYLISYKAPKVKDSVNLILSTSESIISPGEKIKVSLIAQNNTKRYLKNGRFALTGWTIKPDNSLPSLDSGYKDGNTVSTLISESFEPLAPEDESMCEFEIDLPKETLTKDVLWLKGEFIYSDDKSQEQIKRIQRKFDLSIL